MKKQILTLTTGAAIIVATLGLASQSALSQDSIPFGDPDSITYSEQLWATLTGLNLVGKSAQPDTPYQGTHPHGAVLETLTGEATVGEHNGQVIVKRNYGGEGVSIEAVSAEPAKFLKAVTVMFQREEGYDADNQNWFWAKYKPDGSLHTNPKDMKLAGRVAKGKPEGCIACHQAAPGGDYLYTN